MAKTTKLEVINVSSKIKKVLRTHMNLKGFSRINDALNDLLKECPKFIKLSNLMEDFKKSEEIPIGEDK